MAFAVDIRDGKAVAQYVQMRGKEYQFQDQANFEEDSFHDSVVMGGVRKSMRLRKVLVNKVF